MRLPARLEVLRERDFRRVFGAQVVSLFGDGIIPVALAFAVLDLTGSATDLGLVLAARMIPLVGCLLLGGVVADRLSRRRVMIAADVVRMISQALLGLLLVTGEAHLWQLIVLQAVLGAATGFFNPASSGLLPLVVEPGDAPGGQRAARPGPRGGRRRRAPWSRASWSRRSGRARRCSPTR